METIIVKTKIDKFPNLQEHLTRAYEESLNKENLINHNIVKAQFSKWLSK